MINEEQKELNDALLDLVNKGLIQIVENEDGSIGFILMED
jgi:hypothetical protein